MTTRRRRSQRGFTLIELMVSLVLFALITAGLLSVAVTMASGFREQEVTISTESATRSTMDFLSEAIRGASPGVPAMAITQAHNCTLGAFTVADNQAVTNGAAAGITSTTDSLTVVMPHGAVVTSLTAVYVPGTIVVADATGFTDDSYILLTNFNVGHLFRITNVAGNTLTVDGEGGGCPISVTYGIGTVAVRALRARFYVEVPAGETVPMLMMDPDAEATNDTPEPIAEGIESMEVVVAVDTNGDGVLGPESTTANADEWLGNVSGEVTYGVQTAVRAIRINLVARTTKEATGINAYRLPALENRAANAATDNFRRRILTSTIEVRNLGGSP